MLSNVGLTTVSHANGRVTLAILYFHKHFHVYYYFNEMSHHVASPAGQLRGCYFYRTRQE